MLFSEYHLSLSGYRYSRSIRIDYSKGKRAARLVLYRIYIEADTVCLGLLLCQENSSEFPFKKPGRQTYMDNFRVWE